MTGRRGKGASDSQVLMYTLGTMKLGETRETYRTCEVEKSPCACLLSVGCCVRVRCGAIERRAVPASNCVRKQVPFVL